MFLVHRPQMFHEATIIHALYHPWHQHCIIRVMNLRRDISSGKSKSLFLSLIIRFECNSIVIFLWDNTEKKRKKIHYDIQEWHTFMTYDILHNQSTYLTVCLLLDTAHWADYCVTVCGK